jgi:hypothetical protein
MFGHGGKATMATRRSYSGVRLSGKSSATGLNERRQARVDRHEREGERSSGKQAARAGLEGELACAGLFVGQLPVVDPGCGT